MRTAAQALWTSKVLSQGAPWRTRVERRLPALSSLRGHRPAQETRWAGVGKRLMSKPISDRLTLERCALRPGNVHSAEGWREVLEPVIARYRATMKRRYFRADAGFASPEV